MTIAAETTMSQAVFDLRAASRVRLTSIIWLGAIAAAACVAFLQGAAGGSFWPYAAAAAIPGLAGILLAPLMHREWARLALIFSWIALAVCAVFAIAFVPMAILFLCAPAAAALFKREMVIEAMVMSAVAAGIAFYASRWGFAPQMSLPSETARWGEATAPAATIVFMIAAMFAAANSRADLPEISTVRTDEDILSAYPGAAFRTDDTGRVLYASPVAKQAFNRDEAQFYGHDLHQHLNLTPDDRLALTEAISRVQRTGQAEQLIAQVPVGAEREAAMMQFDIAPTSGDGTYVYLRDVSAALSEIEALKREREKAQGTATDKTLFFAGVSHELRTPLNAIIGFSDMMRSRLFGPLPGKYAEYAELIHDSGQHMLDLIGDVLDMSKIESGKYSLTFDDFDLIDVARSSVKMVRPQADAGQVAIDIEIDDDEPVALHADRRAVRQIVLNLLSNAVKFTPKGGRVIVKVTPASDGTRLTITDNGSGMSAEELSKVGQPYAQARSAQMVDARGSGLGLSLVKSLVDLHHGALDIKSAPGEGTAVDVLIPYAPPEGVSRLPRARPANDLDEGFANDLDEGFEGDETPF